MRHTKSLQVKTVIKSPYKNVIMEQMVVGVSAGQFLAAGVFITEDLP